MRRVCELVAVLVMATAVLAAAGCAKRQGSSGPAYEAEVKAESGPVEVKVRVSRKTITLAQTFKVELESAAREGYEVTMPKAEVLMKDLGLRDWRDMGKKLDGQNRVVRTVDVELDPFVSGKYEIPALEFTFRNIRATDPNLAAKEYSVSTEPIELEVTSLPSDPNAKPEIADIEPVMDMPRQFESLWCWLGGGMAVLAVVVSIMLAMRRKGHVEAARAVMPAHELAYQRLRELVAEDLVAQGRIKEFYERISNILRHYIEDRFELRAPERTTEEFLYELQGSGSLEMGDKYRLREFMTHCDLVKFAKLQPQANDIQKAFDLVKEFIEKTRSDLKVVEQPQETPAKEGV
jgi:hypothetical protein